MNRLLLFTIFLFSLVGTLQAQSDGTGPLPGGNQDTTQIKSTPVRIDTTNKKVRPVKKEIVPKRDTTIKKDSISRLVQQTSPDTVLKARGPVDHSSTPYSRVLKANTWFNFYGKAVIRTIEERKINGKEQLFYLIGGLFFLLAVVKAAFGRYFQNLFAVFFRASMKQKQIREQLLQTPLASLLLNLLFVAVAGLYATFIIQGREAGKGINFWLLYGYSVAGLTLLYLGKFFLLKILGWVLRMETSTDTYIFIVFLCNKILGIFLLPLLLVVAFAQSGLATVAMTVSYVLVVGIFLYRYISAYGYINREVRTSRFHFFLYLCAFEVAPLLLIYKVLLKFV